MKALLVLGCAVLVVSCASLGTQGAGPSVQRQRTFSTSFENEADFDGFYVVPNGAYDSAHEWSTERSVLGARAHKAWILRARDVTNDGMLYRPHRAYPTIQLHKSQDGAFVTPVLATLTPDTSDSVGAEGGPPAFISR